MSSAEPTGYRLSPKALEDLEGIWRYTAETWSVPQADSHINDIIRAFEAMVAMPTIGRERTEFTPPVRIHIHQNHILVYVIDNDAVVIVRILGGKQNWISLLQAID